LAELSDVYRCPKACGKDRIIATPHLSQRVFAARDRFTGFAGQVAIRIAIKKRQLRADIAEIDGRQNADQCRHRTGVNSPSSLEAPTYTTLAHVIRRPMITSQPPTL
jgi:hypothetical protein